MPLRSLTARLIVWLVAVQSVLAVATIVVTLALLQKPGNEYAFAQMHAAELVQAALAPGSDGRPQIAETPALAAFRRDRPQVRVAALQGRTALQGSSPELVAALQAAGRPWFADATFAFTEGRLAGSSAVARAVPSRFGQVVVVVADNRFRLSDLPAFATYMGSYLGRVMLASMLGAALVTPFVIARALAPLKAASAQAARIDLRSRGPRLPEGAGVPSELLPLVRSINAALDRLGDGFGRQQRYTAQAAHELRTPLAVMAARIDTLDGHPAAVGLRQDVERMRALVDQLLQRARLERGDVLLDEPLDLESLARDVVTDLAPLALAQERRLTLHTLAVEAPLRGGRRVLEGALANLVRNALRAEPPGGDVLVTIGPGPELAVIDHGPGVSPADRERIFEAFWRRGEDQTGAGLGLTIVREAIDAHAGTVTVEETPGGGATFRIRLPVHQLTPGPPARAGAKL